MYDVVEDIVGEIAIRCIKYKIKLLICPDDAVLYEGDGTYCSGYFLGEYDNPERNVLAVAVGKPESEWLPILLHESSHMDQFLEQSPYWTNTIMDKGVDATDVVFAWITGVDIPYSVDDVIARALQVELDCERRTLIKIKYYSLEDLIDPVEYVKRSNAYVYFYLFMKESRKWCERGRAPHSLKEIWEHAPDTFDNDYTVIPEKLLEAFREHLYAKD
jgi:hypothetical protein